MTHAHHALHPGFAQRSQHCRRRAVRPEGVLDHHVPHAESGRCDFRGLTRTQPRAGQDQLRFHPKDPQRACDPALGPATGGGQWSQVIVGIAVGVPFLRLGMTQQGQIHQCQA